MSVLKQTRTTRGDRVLLGAQVAEQIRHDITQRGLAEGDELPSEGVLAEQHDVSQRVVRDALRLLSQQGVIHTQQGKRATVSRLRPVGIQHYFEVVLDADAAAAEELVDLRLALETKAAAMAAAKATKEDITQLHELADRVDSLGEAASQERVRLDLEFHIGIMRAAGNRFFIAVVEALADVLAEERRHGQQLTEQTGGTHQQSNDEHRALVRAIADHDQALAEQLMRSHLERVRSTFQQRAR